MLQVPIIHNVLDRLPGVHQVWLWLTGEGDVLRVYGPFILP